MTPRAHDFDFVVSAENLPYLAWQALVLRHSCVRQLGREPIVLVHGDEPELLEPYQRLIDDGGRVQRAPNYRHLRGYEYPPRNSPASLLHVNSAADYLVLCDPDIVFVAPWDPAPAMAPDRISFDSVSYLEPDEENRAGLERICERLGAPFEGLLDPRCHGGVPHLIPRALRPALAREWLECLDAFIPEVPAGAGATIVSWLSLASMWSLAIAVIRLGIQPFLTHYCETNHDGGRPWPYPAHPDCPLIHYCYGDASFDKRRVQSLDDRSATSSAPPGSVHEAVVRCIESARRHYATAGKSEH